MANIKFISYETLYDLYINKSKTQKEISEILDVTLKTVQTYMSKHNIKARDTNKDRSLLTQLNIDDEKFKNILQFKYEFQQISINKLAREYNIDQSTIRKYLKKYDIKLRDHKESNKISNSGDKNHKWKGGTKKHSDGYIMLCMPDYPTADKNGYVYEHRYIMEQHLGRFLTINEHIHHINEDKTDNRIENLMVVSPSEHAKLHQESLKKAKLKG